MNALFIHIKRLALTLVVVVASAWFGTLAADEMRQTIQVPRQHPDTLLPLARRTEVPQLPSRMMTSPLPVEIMQQGRQLRIKSRYNQLLPIYTASGTYYSSMRLSKGTNWLTGLPRGAYMINNRRYTIN